MPRSDVQYELPADAPASVVREDTIESGFIGRLQGLKYSDAEQHRVKCMDADDGNSITWHTTGSGKTLTSFKASTLLKENDHFHKCVFVADRKDLDRQTREDWSSSDKTSSKGEARRVSAGSANQFNRFQEGCVEENTNSESSCAACCPNPTETPAAAKRRIELS